ncbi:unnamed protein product (macronuclear) [Paramecium tetraurelia]|uniref:Uncharacterized protein n=1 Tax=Paramecium tetraurelia TaxID=5888 RepID=A0DQM1_PARTE|nr:uncharacterized protein GSPATT00002738001 [Paramecium tetraurelia]CAK85338.1 unnamed protein product [Paramecium tetraurelia]|eukprot:XP_001452735.1 hypothetical protein (macronuclear) [Paramecium tetraurelia strain d4-2]
MICDIIDIPLLTPSQKVRISYSNTTASPASSSDSSFESKQIPNLQIPRPLLSQDEKFEASFCSFGIVFYI